jgi:glycosyltransferase involved in cell wall biosynthesis
MHVVISLLNFRPGKIGGTETYLRKLIPELARQRENDRITLMTYRDNQREILPEGVDLHCLPYNAKAITRMRVLEAFTPWRARQIERAFDALKPDVVFFPQQSMFPKRLRQKKVMTVLDFQHLVIPSNFSIADRAFRAAIYPYSLRAADRLVTISDFTRQELQQFYPGQQAKASVALLGYDPPANIDTTESSGVSGPYIYYPAASLVHKNHLGLFETIAKLKGRGEFPFQLILSGIQTPYWNKLQQHITRLGLDDVVQHVGYISYARVQALYRDARAVVFPTTYEGFGLPIMEAISAGKPVIVSRLAVFRELGVPDQWCIDFADADQLAAALEQTGPTVLERTPPDWASCASLTWQVLRSLANSQ